MPKIIFVCYDQGAGGEHLAVEISKMDCCHTLRYKTVNGRYMTVDVTLGRCRYNVLPVNEINDALVEFENKKRVADNLSIGSVNESARWHVIPTHFLPNELEEIQADKLFICITTPVNEGHLKNIQSKVLSYRYRSILELKGQIEADGYNPDKIITKHKGPLDYQSLLCLYNDMDINEANINILTNAYMKERRIYSFQHPVDNSLNVRYEDTILPNFYTDFTNTLHKQLTKSI